MKSYITPTMKQISVSAQDVIRNSLTYENNGYGDMSDYSDLG